MRTALSLQKRFLAFFETLSIAKWQYIYYAMAAFDLLTVASSMYLNHRIMEIYAQSIEVNQQWAVRLANYSNLGQLVAAVNAPGNDVFDSQNINSESSRLKFAQDSFQKKIYSIRDELKTLSNPSQADSLLKNLDAVEAAMADMVAETERIFSFFRKNQPEAAGKRMATMDRRYHQVNEALNQFRQNVSQIQQDLLVQQKRSADKFRQYELAIASAMLLMVTGIMFYGHQLAKKMKLNAQQKEQSFAELQQTEAFLKEQTLELQQALENLQKTQLQLVQSEKMSSLGELVAGVAHEINNPVNFIHGNLTYVQEYSHNLLTTIQLYQTYYPNAVPEIQAQADAIDLDFLQEDLIRLLDSMKLGTDRIRQIVLSLRNFSRLDEVDFKPVNIHEGIDSTLSILQHRLKARSDRPAIKVIRDYGTLSPVECYPGQLNQVFMNLLANAIDALEECNMRRTAQEMEAEPSQIRIRTSMLDAQWVEIAIADNGVGIPEQIQKRIFDPFFTTKPIGKGTGMGMSISYQIITEKHGGKLQCFSTIGQGAEFVIQIPIRQPAIEKDYSSTKI